jgi:hypothetical protein
MLLNCMQDAKRTKSVGLALLVIGLLTVAAGTSAKQASAALLHLTPQLNDFAHGFCIGLGIALEIGALVVLARCMGSRVSE